MSNTEAERETDAENKFASSSGVEMVNESLLRYVIRSVWSGDSEGNLGQSQLAQFGNH